MIDNAKVFESTVDGRFEMLRRCEAKGNIFGPYHVAKVADREQCTELASVHCGRRNHGKNYCDFHSEISRGVRGNLFDEYYYGNRFPKIVIDDQTRARRLVDFGRIRSVYCSWLAAKEVIGHRPSWEYGIEVEMAFNRYDDYLRSRLAEYEKEFIELTGLPEEEVFEFFKSLS